MSYDPDLVGKLVTTPRWSAVARTGLTAAALGTWDPALLRGPRVLVPVDVQAYVVPRAGTDERCVRLPSPLTPGSSADAAALAGPAPFTDGTPREPGVHLHWAMPDALLQTTLTHTGSGGRTAALTLPALPDRWAVLRLTAPDAGGPCRVDGSVVLATTGQVLPLSGFGGAAPAPDLPPDQLLVPAALTGTAGGSLHWTAGYDAALSRFALHDPLADLAADPTLGGGLPGGPHAGVATYLVLGWWSQGGLDPLDGVRTDGGLTETLAALDWSLPPGPASAPAGQGSTAERSVSTLRRLGVRVAGRDGDVSPDAGAGEGLAGLVGEDAATLVRGHLRLAPSGSALLHGAVVSVPVDGSVPAVDLRPDGSTVAVVAARTTTEALAVLGAPALAGAGDADAQAVAERLLAAFAAGRLRSLGSTDGVVELDERRHALGFAARADAPGTGVVDRVRTRTPGIPARPPRPRSGSTVHLGTETHLTFVAAERVATRVSERAPTETAQKAAAYGYAEAVAKVATSATAARTYARELSALSGDAVQAATAARTAASSTSGTAPSEQPDPGRSVERPLPPWHQPVDPALVVSGAHRSLRFGGDGRHNPDGSLRVRRPEDVAQDYAGVLRGDQVLPALTSGALPAETLALAREAALLSPDWVRWMAATAAGQGLDPRATMRRLGAELALRYDRTGAYTQAVSLMALGGDPAAPDPARSVGLTGRAGARGAGDLLAETADEALRAHSLLAGVEPSPVAVTAWAQPWVPLWIEWEMEVRTVDPADPGDPLAGWAPGPVDAEPDPAAPPPEPPRTVTATGRAVLSPSPADGLREAVLRWLREEDERDARGAGELAEDAEARLGALARHVDQLDLVAASLDGVGDALRGLATPVVRARDAGGALVPPTPLADPLLVLAGRLQLTRVRLVDAFGRTLDLDPKAIRVPAHDTDPSLPGGGVLLQRPRLSRPCRLRLDPVDATATDPATAPAARVDEIDPGQQVTPVAGFLLPNHVDQSLQVFADDGTPVGELLTTAVGGAVRWEPAPGRPLPPDASPGAGLDPGRRPLGALGAGMLAADALARADADADARRATDTGADTPARPESALAAFLRAVDTTMWSVDPLAGAGSSAPGSIIGRPLAVVRAVLRLEVLDDLGGTPAELTLDDDTRARRALAYARLARLEVPVRVGEVTRTDDGVIGFFLDDDHTRFHLVDRSVADLALGSGPGRGVLGPYGTPFDPTDLVPLDHRYLVPDGVVRLRPGVPRLLTLLMLPGSAAHVTSGLVPRLQVRLQKAWYGDGLDALSPSVRVGPVLLDPGEVRLPRVAALDEHQVFTRREGPLGWRDDPILAATQAALLPETPTTAQEGWIRVLPRTAGPGPATP